MATTAKSVTVYCLDCDHAIRLSSQLKIGQVVNCPNCEAELEIINLEPVEVDFYYEDWDDEDDDWDEDEDDDEDDDWDD